jgi:hypothetical protein
MHRDSSREPSDDERDAAFHHTTAAYHHSQAARHRELGEHAPADRHGEMAGFHEARARASAHAIANGNSRSLRADRQWNRDARGDLGTSAERAPAEERGRAHDGGDRGPRTDTRNAWDRDGYERADENDRGDLRSVPYGRAGGDARDELTNGKGRGRTSDRRGPG